MVGTANNFWTSENGGLDMVAAGHYFHFPFRDDDTAIAESMSIFGAQNELVDKSKHCASGLIFVDNHASLIA
jgi:hypothetical protein